MIPVNKPVTGRDLGDLRLKLGYTTDEMAFLCGVNKNRYHLMVNKEADEPLRSIPTAIMARLLDDDPSLSFLPKFPSPQDLFDEMEPYGISKREFSVILGNHGTAMQRWGQSMRRAIPQVYRLALVIQKMMHKKGAGKTIPYMKGLVDKEASLRGVKDIFSHGRWNPKPPKKKTD